MSALTWDDVAVTDGSTAVALAPAPTREVHTPAARHLQLVSAGAEVATEEGGTDFALTRRGRLAVTISVLVALAVAAVIGVSMATATPAPIASIAGPSVTVAAGETMSEIAARELPGLPIREGVARIQVINNLSTTAISAGQMLVIPAN